jgi:hypothetical protein
MKVAYGVELAESVRKTEDKTDRANYGVWIRQFQYYFKPGEYVRNIRQATPMTEQCAKQLAAKLKNTAQVVQVVELLADDEVYLPTSLDELTNGPSSPAESAGRVQLKTAVEELFKSGLSQIEVMDLCTRAVIQGT